MRKGVRKITPTPPLLPAPAASTANVPPEVAAAARGCTDAAQLQLQASFLAMHSTPASKVQNPGCWCLLAQHVPRMQVASCVYWDPVDLQARVFPMSCLNCAHAFSEP